MGEDIFSYFSINTVVEEDIDYLGLIRRAKQVIGETGEIEEELRTSVAGYLEPEGHEEFPRYIGEEVEEAELQEAAEAAAKHLNSLYYLKIQTDDLADNLDAGRIYELGDREIHGTTLRNRLRDLHEDLLDEESSFLELAVKTERYTDLEPVKSSYRDYSRKDLSNPD